MLSLTEDCRFVNLRVFEEISAIFRFPRNGLNRLYLSHRKRFSTQEFLRVCRRTQWQVSCEHTDLGNWRFRCGIAGSCCSLVPCWLRCQCRNSILDAVLAFAPTRLIGSARVLPVRGQGCLVPLHFAVAARTYPLQARANCQTRVAQKNWAE